MTATAAHDLRFRSPSSSGQYLKLVPCQPLKWAASPQSNRTLSFQLGNAAVSLTRLWKRRRLRSLGRSNSNSIPSQGNKCHFRHGEIKLPMARRLSGCQHAARSSSERERERERVRERQRGEPKANFISKLQNHQPPSNCKRARENAPRLPRGTDEIQPSLLLPLIRYPNSYLYTLLVLPPPSIRSQSSVLPIRSKKRPPKYVSAKLQYVSWFDQNCRALGVRDSSALPPHLLYFPPPTFTQALALCSLFSFSSPLDFFSSSASSHAWVFWSRYQCFPTFFVKLPVFKKEHWDNFQLLSALSGCVGFFLNSYHFSSHLFFFRIARCPFFVDDSLSCVPIEQRLDRSH